MVINRVGIIVNDRLTKGLVDDRVGIMVNDRFRNIVRKSF
jgi:hypothetical protein